MNPNNQPQTLLLSMSQVCSRLGLSRPTVYRLIREGDFPPRIKLGKNVKNYFRAADINKWVAELDGGPTPDLTEKVKNALQNSTKYVASNVKT